MSIEENTLINLGSTRDTITFNNHKTLPMNQRRPGQMIHSQIVLKDIIGEGGMGIVYRAVQDYPRREVAIKRLRDNASHLRWALIQEAMITGEMEHPGTVPIYSLNLAGNSAPEVVMQCIKGKNLLELINGNVPNEADLRKYISALIQVCNALEYAHKKGIIHRDIKPENIMLGDFGEVYLLDWGIAVKKEDEELMPFGMVGTPVYMAPEMLSGDPNAVDERTDIYLMGATLHEIITGSPRHFSNDFNTTLELVKKSEPHNFSDETPKLLAALVNQSCSLNPQNRPQSIELFRKKLRDFLHNREAIVLSNIAAKELAHLKRIINNGIPLEIYRHFHRARFGFEHALTIWPNCEQAKRGIYQSLELMINYHITQNNVELALTLMQVIEDPSESTIIRFNKLTKKKAKDDAEKLRLAQIGSKNDPRTSRNWRMFFNYALLFAAAIYVFFLFQLDSTSIENVTIELLHSHSIIMILPVIPIIILGRKHLIFNPHGQRVSIGIGGALFIMCINRWFAIQYQTPVQVVLLTDILIFGLGIANTAPSIKSGPILSLIFMAMAFINHFYPSTFWVGGLSLMLITMLLVTKDFYAEWKHDAKESN